MKVHKKFNVSKKLKYEMHVTYASIVVVHNKACVSLNLFVTIIFKK